MKNSRIYLICYWNNRIKNSSDVFEHVFFLCRMERNLLKINKKSLTVFENK